jgi:hypothetical protein
MNRPLSVAPLRLPRAFPKDVPIDPEFVERDLERARAFHPELRRLAIEREKRLLEVEFARNEVLPNLRQGIEVARDLRGSRAGIDEGVASDQRDSNDFVDIEEFLAEAIRSLVKKDFSRIVKSILKSPARHDQLDHDCLESFSSFAGCQISLSRRM